MNMSNNQIANILMMLLGLMFFILFVLIVIYLFIRFKQKKKENNTVSENVSEKSKVEQLYSLQSIFKFMEFDRIEDNMIVQKKGKRFLMVVKCQGINYDLMSGAEKNSVEQGFIQYLNALRYPIQIYVQTRTVDLTGSIETYKQKVRNLADNLANKEFEYNQKVRRGNVDRHVLDAEKFEIVKARNLYEYGTDIVNNTERMSLNKNILTKQYYIILSYYPDEANDGVYSSEEISNIAFSELYTRAQSTISLIGVCGINAKILDSTELADLLYSAYNRDEAETYDLHKALNSGYDSLYITAPDVLDKKMQELDRQIEIEATRRANDAINEARKESEKERNLREKENDYDEIVSRLADIIIDENEEFEEAEVIQKAKEKIREKKPKESMSRNKEEKVNGKEKVRKSGRPRKTV